ncbi:unnamed protein product [Clonostachys rosea f. rosea IK726]|uniref:Uncharacterized protein n=1 Tax=Clonostachys rosea f. rosea IK726 TaxID=1349383 RepID=A0ACA9T9D0_BIOOC|nr:unnamed protein product [Clonostachys rosea f. rosea IK726]
MPLLDLRLPFLPLPRPTPPLPTAPCADYIPCLPTYTKKAGHLYRFNYLYFLKMEYPPYYHDNDVGPFSSVTYSLTPDGPGLHELDLKLRDRDVVLMVEGDDDDKTVRILHLYNVREDTLAEAKTAVDGLLGQVKPLGGSDNTGHTVFKMFDKVFYEIKSPVACILEDADDLESKLEAIDEDDLVHPKRAADTTSELSNPVAELQAACRDFIDRRGKLPQEKGYDVIQGI